MCFNHYTNATVDSVCQDFSQGRLSTRVEMEFRLFQVNKLARFCCQESDEHGKNL